jgi:hypothetical protein
MGGMKIRRGSDGALRTTIKACGHARNPAEYMMTHVYLGSDEWPVAGPGGSTCNNPRRSGDL